MSIENELETIKNSPYIENMRDAIHDGIKKAYDDASANGNANMEVEMARGTEPTLNDRLNKMDDKDENLTAQLAQKAEQESLLIERERINNLIDLPEGSTTGDAQLADIKVGADGETYASPGDAVRANDVKNKNKIDEIEESILGKVIKIPFNSSIQYDSSKVNYHAVVHPKLEKGISYALEFIPNTSFSHDAIQIGTNSTIASMVDTLAENIEFVAGESYWIEKYIPSASELGYIRVLNNALKIDVVNAYTYDREGGKIPLVENRVSDSNLHFAAKTNKNIKELREVQNVIENSVSSLIKVKLSEGAVRNALVPSVGAREKYLLRVGLHYGSEKYTPSADEIFFDQTCEKNFSDVRFFDGDGNILKAQFGKLVNIELYQDDDLNKMLKVTSDGKIVGFETGSGIVISGDNGATYTAIPNTANVTVNASTTYRRTDLYPVFVDSSDNIFAYAGGVLYKLYASDNYTTKKDVLDFSWDNNGTTIYPDIQDHGMDESSSGAFIIGADYQSLRNTRLFHSKDGGETFQLSWESGLGTDYQHTHHVHADPHSNKVYAGIDDGGTTFEGARTLVTEDDGDTWTNITYKRPEIRGADYYPTYFGTDYRLGGGESYLNGGGAIYKADASDSNFKIPVKGKGGVRSYADFGTDDLIVAGLQHARGNSVNQILTSEDKGESWDVIYSKQQEFLNTSGGGFRRVQYVGTLMGDTEPCVVLSQDFGNVKPTRIYKGGDHYYREAYIELENIPDGPIDITAETGYMMEYPYKSLNGRSHDGLVYAVPLNEGVGNAVTDSLGNTVKINGDDFKWESDEPVRFGDYKEYGRPLVPSSAIQLKKGTTINFGKIPELNFFKGYTVTFWINSKNKWADPAEYPNRSKRVMSLFSAGNVSFFNKMIYFGYGEQSITETNFSTSGYSMMSVTANGYTYSDEYHFVAISVDSSGHVDVFVNGGKDNSYSNRQENALFALDSLSDGDFIIGSETLLDAGFLSDIKFYNRVIPEKEIIEMYKGW